METAGLHQLRFYPRECPYEVDVNYLDATTKALFGMPLSSFTHLSSYTHNKRKYKKGYTFENKIILLVGDYTKRYPLAIEINGGAFDHLSINMDKISRLIEQDYIVSAIHAKIDTDTTPFKQLFQAYQLDAVTAASVKRSDRQSSSRTIIFGADPAYTIYEAGRLHPELNNTKIVRHEIRFTGEQARQFFTAWRQDLDNLAKLIKAYIAGHFQVRFRDYTASDTNNSRRPILPLWERWMTSAVPRRFDLVTPTKPQLANQIKTYTAKLLKLKIELGEQVFAEILGNVEELYRQPITSDSQEVQLDLSL